MQRYAGGFDKAVTRVFGAGRQYPELERKLRINAGRFGTYKTYDLCRQLQQAREAGLSLDEFKEFATGSIGIFNGYQKTEYNTLIARARTAKQWERFQTEKQLYPNIEWLRTASANPRPDHLTYVGLILPIDDPFWTNNQPGNEYNCKCDWRTTDKPAGERPNDDKIYRPAAGLEGNPAQTGELVTQKHPYFRRNQNAPRWVDDKAVLQCPDDVCFIEKTAVSGQKYVEHLLAATRDEISQNRLIVEELLNNGYKDVKLLPQIHKSEMLLRKRYFGENYIKLHPTKNPDSIVDGNFLEFKTCNKKHMSERILEASTQSDMAVIKTKETLTNDYVDSFVKRQWLMQDRKNLKTIMILNNNTLHTFKRP